MVDSRGACPCQLSVLHRRYGWIMNAGDMAGVEAALGVESPYSGRWYDPQSLDQLNFEPLTTPPMPPATETGHTYRHQNHFIAMDPHAPFSTQSYLCGTTDDTKAKNQMGEKMLLVLGEWAWSHHITTTVVEYEDWTAMIEWAEAWCIRHGHTGKFKVAFRRSLLEKTMRGPVEHTAFRELMDTFVVVCRGRRIRMLDDEWDWLCERLQEMYVATG